MRPIPQMKSRKVAFITALIAMSLGVMANQAKAQKVSFGTVDEAQITVDADTANQTTGQILRPAVNFIYKNGPLSVDLNGDQNQTSGYWDIVDASDNLSGMDMDISGNILYSNNNFPDSLADEPIKIRYMLRDAPNAHHGVVDKLDRHLDRYIITGLINYTDTATGQPESIEFELPNHLFKYFDGIDTTAQTPFKNVSYGLNQPQKLDSVLNNIHDVMVLPDFEQNKENLAQMNENTPYSGIGDSITSTLEVITDGGINSPWDPGSVTFTSLDPSKSSYSKPVSDAGGDDPDKGDGDAIVTDDFTVTQLMPDATINTNTTWGNQYQMVVSSPDYEPDIGVSSDLPAETLIKKVNDTTYNITVLMKSGDSQGSYNVSVDFDEIFTGVPERPDFEATNFPNPFSDNARLRYTLDEADLVDIVVYDVQGRQVDEVFNGRQQAGTHELSIDGSSYAPGTYIVNISSQSGGSHAMKLIRE